MTARFSIETGPAPGAVGVIRLLAESGEELFDMLGCRPVPLGDARVRAVFELDEMLVARPDEGCVLLMPHGGRAVMRAVVERLVALGLREDALFAAGLQERLDEAIAVAASPLAVDLLLDQPRRWSEQGEENGLADEVMLSRLLTPPVVVAVGAANIGKSSLLNALAGRHAALAFDRPGTTRDAVGVLLDCAGLVVRWVDTPGLDGTDAACLVSDAVRTADLVICCRDAGSIGTTPVIPPGVPVIHVATRSDRGASGGEGLHTSAVERSGLTSLVRAIRRTLVPDEVLGDPRPWRFWDPRMP